MHPTFQLFLIALMGLGEKQFLLDYIYSDKGFIFFKALSPMYSVLFAFSNPLLANYIVITYAIRNLLQYSDKHKYPEQLNQAVLETANVSTKCQVVEFSFFMASLNDSWCLS